MIELILFFAGMFALLNLVFLIVLIARYFWWRGYDKEFATEYRFRQGKREGFDGLPWLIPLWLENMLRRLEEVK